MEYAADVKVYVPDVPMSVVGGTIPGADVEICRKIAREDLGMKFRVR